MNPIQRIARNSAAPIITQLLNKVVDFAFTIAVLRLIGVAGYGQYEFAVLVWLYTKTFTDFGLATLATRDIARDRNLASGYLGLTTLLRLVLWLATLPIVTGFTVAYRQFSDLSTASALAIVLLILSIVPDSYSDSANAVYNAFERMEIPALLTFVKNLLKVAIGLALLLTGWGPVGLALTALITNVVTAALFGLLLRRLDVRATWTLPGAQARTMLVESWPLFLNALLAGLFFRSDVFIIKATRGEGADIEVGMYGAAYKFLNLVLLIPQYFTLALFPHLSRLAATRDATFNATYALAVKLLLMLALPLCVATAYVAPDLMWLLGGQEFLPDSAVALRILIWFLPLSYVNGMVQYVLIAAGLQRSLIPAFGLTAAFNLIMNLIFTPLFGYKAAAVITIGSEVVLLIPFLWYLRRHIGLPDPGIAVRPLLAAAAMGLLAWPIQRAIAAQGLVGVAPWVAILAGGAIYLLVLLATGGIGATEKRLAQRLLGRGA